MNFELSPEKEKQVDQAKPLVIDLTDDAKPSASSSLGKYSMYNEIGYNPFTDTRDDSTDQIINQKETIHRDYKNYFTLIHFVFCISVALTVLYIVKHEGLWMIFTCFLEGFCLYTWLLGFSVKEKLRTGLQHQFLSCLFTVIIIKILLCFLGIYSIISWGIETKENLAETKDSKSKAIDFIIIFSLLQLGVGGFIYNKGRKLLDELAAREFLIDNRERSDSNNLVVL